MLSLLIFIPFLIALIIGLTPKGARTLHRALGLAGSLITLGLSMAVWSSFQTNDFHFQLVEKVAWLPELGINYLVGIDGISLWMVFLTAFLAVAGCAYSIYEDKERSKAFYVLMMVLLGSMVGSFLALDMVLFYTFFELSLFPVAFMIWIWGGADKKRAAIRYFVYLFGGSILMLVGMVFLAVRFQQTNGILSFSIIDIQNAVAHGQFWSGAMYWEPVIFWLFALAFLIKSPAFPFHTWMVDSYTQAPIGAVLLGVLVKVGVYGLIRFCLPLFPDALPSANTLILTLAVIGILYGAAAAAVQKDIKRVIAFSSVSHVGFLVLGVFSMNQNGIMGGVLGGFYHGIASGMLILMVHLLTVRTGSGVFSKFGGIKSRMPVFSALFLVATMAAIGLPGTNGFISEFLSLAGTFEGGFMKVICSVGFGVAATAGVILSVIYMLLLYQKVFLGKIEDGKNLTLKDCKGWEAIGLAVFALLIIWGGLMPSTFTKAMETSASAARLMAINGPDARPSWADKSEAFGADNALYANRVGYGVIKLSDPNYHESIKVFMPSSQRPAYRPPVPAAGAKGQSGKIGGRRSGGRAAGPSVQAPMGRPGPNGGPSGQASSPDRGRPGFGGRPAFGGRPGQGPGPNGGRPGFGPGPDGQRGPRFGGGRPGQGPGHGPGQGGQAGQGPDGQRGPRIPGGPDSQGAGKASTGQPGGSH